MKTRFFVALLALLAALVVVPPASADQSNKVKTVPVQQLSERVEKLIKIVEDSTLPCATRNSVVRRLRLLDDALRSGRRSAARSMVLAWRQHAWNLQAARVIYPELGSSLQTQLGDMVDEIGFGWPDKPGPTRHWKPLPACKSNIGSYNPAATDPSLDVKIFINMVLGLVPEVGGIMNGMVDLLWPQGPDTDANLFHDMVKQEAYDLVKGELEGIGDVLMGKGGTPEQPLAESWNGHVADWRKTCDENGGFDSYACYSEARDTLFSMWDGINTHDFGDRRWAFQQSTSEVSQVDLLPLFAQYENLYMTFLRDGLLLHKYWRDCTELTFPPPYTGLNRGWTSKDDKAAGTWADEWDTTNDKIGVAYLNKVYNDGLPKGDWATNNHYIRGMTLNVLDYRDIWKYMDPRAYPGGVPGGVKLTRMIYSDPAGSIPSSPNFPSNVPGPLKEISVWTTEYDPSVGVKYLVIDAVQATSPPLLGPAQCGAITGDTSQPVNHAHYSNLAALGPIIEVEAQIEPHFYTNSTSLMGYFPRWIGFDYAAGTSASTTAGDKGSGFGDCKFPLVYGCNTAIQYDGEVLATAQSGRESFDEAGGVVFGFRFADSFNPAGEVIGVDSGKCIRLASFADGTQAEIYTCNSPPAPDQVWTYDANLQQISVTNPADNSKYCLNAAGGRTTAGTSVVINNPCDDGALLPLLSSNSQTYDTQGNPVVSSQRWTIDGVDGGFAKITNVKSGLVVTASSADEGAGLSLASDVSHPTQQWQAHWPLTGEIHGIGSGRCVDMPVTTPGTQVEIYDCNGTWAQQWTYDPTKKELIFAMAPSLCLEARGGSTSSGTAVQINTCTGAPEQQWTLEGLSYSVNQGGGGTITNVKSELVMDVQGGSTANDTLVQLYKSNGTENQQWSRTSTQGGALHAVGAGKCLTVPAGSTQPVIQTCASPLSAEQIWTYHPFAQTFTVTGPSGTMCLTGYGYSASIDACNGTVYQRWSLDFGKQTVTNLYNGLVLDVAGGGTADGTAVGLWTLHDPVSSNQQWVWPLY